MGITGITGSKGVTGSTGITAYNTGITAWYQGDACDT